MIIIQLNEIIICGSSITDWIQSFGAIVAIVGVYLGWQQFRKDSKEKQSQIDVLTDLAKEAKEQTTHLASQVDQMIEGNELQTKYISLYQRTVSTNEESLKLQHDKIELDKQLRKKEILPIFKVQLSETNMPFKETDIYLDFWQVQLTFTNTGKTSTLLHHYNFPDNTHESNYEENLYKEYSYNEGFVLSLQPTNPYKQVHEYMIHFKIVFKDLEGNKYFQNIEIEYGEPPKISKPFEMLTV